jgi:RNA polymerase sigma factor (sigma-70 family)
VWSVCRRIARTHHDAEDAFQATFLVLIRKAYSIEPRHMLANWLYGVAYKTSLNAKMIAAKRQGRERLTTEMPEPAVSQQHPWHDQQELIHEELNRLPDKYRVLIILCELEGKSRKEAAQLLSCPEGTVAGRLARARAILARRLSQRGVASCGGSGTLAALFSEGAASAKVLKSIRSSILHNLTYAATGQALEAGMISTKVLTLTEGAMNTMLFTKSNLAAVLIAAVAITGTAGLIAPINGAQESRQVNNAIKDKKVELPRSDSVGPFDGDRALGGTFAYLNTIEYQVPLLTNDKVMDVFFSDNGTVELPAEKKDPTKDDTFPDGRNHDFGEVKKGTTLHCEFGIVNTSNEPLHLNEIRRTYTGLTGAVDKEVLQPKEEAKLLVTFKTDKLDGKTTQTLYLTTNQPKSGNVAAYVFRLTAKTVQEKDPANPIAGGSIGVIKESLSSDDYRDIFVKLLQMIAHHFEDISHANRHDGRIEAATMASAKEPSAETRRVTAEIRARDGGGFLVYVRVAKGIMKGNDWVPTGRDVELEKRILKLVGFQEIQDEKPSPGGATLPSRKEMEKKGKEK